MAFRVELAKRAETDLEALYVRVTARAPHRGPLWFNGMERAILSLGEHPAPRTNPALTRVYFSAPLGIFHTPPHVGVLAGDPPMSHADGHRKVGHTARTGPFHCRDRGRVLLLPDANFVQHSGRNDDLWCEPFQKIESADTREQNER